MPTTGTDVFDVFCERADTVHAHMKINMSLQHTPVVCTPLPHPLHLPRLTCHHSIPLCLHPPPSFPSFTKIVSPFSVQVRTGRGMAKAAQRSTVTVTSESILKISGSSQRPWLTRMISGLARGEKKRVGMAASHLLIYMDTCTLPVTLSVCVKLTCPPTWQI